MSTNPDDFGKDQLAEFKKKREEILARKKAPKQKDMSIPDIPDELQQQNSVTDKLPQRPSILEERLSKRKQAEALAEASQKSGKEDPSGNKKKKPVNESTAAATGVDYMEDYDDENEMHISNRMGFSTRCWGDEQMGFVPESTKKLKKKQIRLGKFVPGDAQLAYNKLISSGVRFVDTSEAYGAVLHGKTLSSESMVGRFTEEYTLSIDLPQIATKFGNPYSLFASTTGRSGVRFGAGSVLRALEKSCERMETSNIELYQIDNIGLSLLYAGGSGALANGLAQAIDKGYCNHVGVVDASPRKLRSLQKKLEKRGASLSSNQFEFSMTNRKALKNGTIQACKDLGIVPIVRDPIGGGLASGQYTASNPSGGMGVNGPIKYEFKVLEPLMPLHEAQISLCKKVSKRLFDEFQDGKNNRGGRTKGFRERPGETGDRSVTPYQLAINYVIAKGCVPIPEINNSKQADELLGCIGWSLTDDEVAALDNAAEISGR